MKKMKPLEYYEQATSKTIHSTGDYIRIYFADGGEAVGMVTGVLTTGTDLHICLSKGSRHRLRENDRVEILFKGQMK